MKINTLLIAGIALAAIGAVTLPQQQQQTLQQRPPLADRIRAIQLQQRVYKEKDDSAPGKHEVVLLTAYSTYFFNESTNGSVQTYVYGQNGFSIYNADSSSGAPQFQGPISVSTYDTNTHQSTDTVTNTPPSFSQAVADLLNEGYKIVNSTLDNQYGFAPTVLLVK